MEFLEGCLAGSLAGRLAGSLEERLAGKGSLPAGKGSLAASLAVRLEGRQMTHLLADVQASLETRQLELGTLTNLHRK